MITCKCSIELQLLYVECLERGRVQDYLQRCFKHFYEKWNSLANKSILGAAERFYAELSDNNRELLVNRAVALYDGKATREEPHDDDILVCDSCGSRQIEIQARCVQAPRRCCTQGNTPGIRRSLLQFPQQPATAR